MDVVRVGDVPGHDQAQSLFIDRRGRARLTRRLAEELGGGPVILEAVEESDVDVTLILGADYRSLGLVDLSDSQP
jgi:hypothetical protein